MFGERRSRQAQRYGDDQALMSEIGPAKCCPNGVVPRSMLLVTQRSDDMYGLRRDVRRNFPETRIL